MDTPKSQDSKTGGEQYPTRTIVFFCMPSTGKSYFTNLFTEKVGPHAEIRNISKDTVSVPMLSEYKAKHPELSFGKCYLDIKEDMNLAFDKLSIEALRKLNSDPHDKAHPPVLIIDDVKTKKRLVKMLANESKEVIAVYPKVTTSQKLPNYPFSSQLILTLAARVLERQGHETLNDENYPPAVKLQILLSFILKYKGLKSMTEIFKIDKVRFVPVEFHNELVLTKEEIDEPVQKIYDQISLCLEKMEEPFEEPFVKGRAEVEKLVEMIRELKSQQPEIYKKYVGYAKPGLWDSFYSLMTTKQ